ncbi:GATA zinc finger domain-containing protein 14 [Parasteatoda tepidariorum]|uniref:GATA zinc finger domain-containing protein 14 n=1 Tax=Parasteatoda tepidariorum TaxID=114398 RepID=UPI00077FE0D8|nr:uncharacterized protein LOC107450893 [Parasteatoda tepidariorum]
MKFYSQADEMRDYCSFYFIIFLIVWAFSETDAIRRRNEKNQQTFVVRYKNGDQTIPVTVVLDDKKQTEYVINMSPRTPEKSVTLYDFKQRTIAYKDLTNRECFLGRLTDETLNHEINALSEVQSPIESHPKVLSLVPHKSALTPTEIRNIAGQQTAVFCRKMNTWLIMPQGNHRILKREVDEVEERSYSRHGFHTVKYSHHGHETRRRYRKPSATSSQSTLEEQSIPEPQSRKNGLQSWNSTSENVSKDDLPLENQFERHGGDNHYSSLFVPERNFKHGDHPKIKNENFSSDYLDKNKRPLETDLNSSTHQSPGSLTKYEDYLNRDLVVDSNNKKYIQSSEWDPLLYPSTLQNRNGEMNNRNTNDGTLNAHYRKSNIETEGDFSNETLDIPEGKILLTSDIPEEHNENPDVSINVLEIPKISKKFETVGHVPGIHETFVQPDEDVHSIFEGFHNLNGNLAASRSHDSYSPVSLNTIRNRQRTKTVSDDSLKAIDSETSPTQDRVPFNNFYVEHISQTTTSTPASKQKHFLATNSLNTNTLNLDKIDYSDSLPKNINHHHKSEVLFENNFLSGKLNPAFDHSQISVENKNNINSIPHLRFNNHNVPTNFNIRNSDDKQQNSDKFVKNQPVFPPNQVHLHDILRNFKPDEIVIDIEKIPTEKPPDSTSSFRGRDTSFTRNHDHLPSSNKTYSFHSLGRNRNIENVTNSSRTINHSQNLPSQRSHLSRTRNFQFHSSNQYPASLPSHNFLRTDAKEDPFLGQLPRLGALPPGVSLHPRHPQAPYADMVRTNMLHTLPQRNINRAIKPHRQRHHRRKDHHDSGSCCKSNSKLSTCCSWHLRRGMHINSSCCASLKHRDSLNQRNLIPSVHSRRVKYRNAALPIKDTLPVQVLQNRDNLPPMQRKIHDDKKDRCQKAKMCRTLYESTRQVMVCRNINVDGC